MTTEDDDLFTPRITSMRFEPRPRFKVIREFVLSPTDAARFGSELRGEFPTIRFLPCDYSEHWMEREFGEPEFGSNRRNTISERMRPPHGDAMPYAMSPGDIKRDRTLAWVEPPGWTPQWSAKPYRGGRYVLRNEPHLQFIFLRSDYWVEPTRRSRPCPAQPPASLAEGEVCHLYDGYLHGPYLPDDIEQQDFLRRVWRIARRVTTNRLARVDLTSLESHPEPEKNLSLRAGLDAAEWTRRDRRHVIGGEFAYRAADAFRGNDRS